jgi:hypothetical protein
MKRTISIAESSTHHHAYTTLIHDRDFGTALDGRVIDRIIISRQCSCGKTMAIDCGTKQEMRQLWAELAKTGNMLYANRH